MVSNQAILRDTCESIGDIEGTVYCSRCDSSSGRVSTRPGEGLDCDRVVRICLQVPERRRRHRERHHLNRKSGHCYIAEQRGYTCAYCNSTWERLQGESNPTRLIRSLREGTEGELGNLARGERLELDRGNVAVILHGIIDVSKSVVSSGNNLGRVHERQRSWWRTTGCSRGRLTSYEYRGDSTENRAKHFV